MSPTVYEPCAVCDDVPYCSGLARVRGADKVKEDECLGFNADALAFQGVVERIARGSNRTNAACKAEMRRFFCAQEPVRAAYGGGASACSAEGRPHAEGLQECFLLCQALDGACVGAPGGYAAPKWCEERCIAGHADPPCYMLKVCMYVRRYVGRYVCL